MFPLYESFCSSNHGTLHVPNSSKLNIHHQPRSWRVRCFITIFWHSWILGLQCEQSWRSPLWRDPLQESCKVTTIHSLPSYPQDMARVKIRFDFVDFSFATNELLHVSVDFTDWSMQWVNGESSTPCDEIFVLRIRLTLKQSDEDSQCLTTWIAMAHVNQAHILLYTLLSIVILYCSVFFLCKESAM